MLLVVEEIRVEIKDPYTFLLISMFRVEDKLLLGDQKMNLTLLRPHRHIREMKLQGSRKKAREAKNPISKELVV